MFRGVNTRQVLESYQSGETQTRNGTGARAFVRDYRELLGLRRDSAGIMRRFPTIESGEPARDPESSSIRDLALAIVGEDWVQAMNPAHQPDPLDALESADGAITPGNFPNTSLYFSTITGMLEAKALQAYSKPEYIADQVCPAQPSNLRSEKMVGIGRVGDQAKIMLPGESHPLVNGVERFVTTPDTAKRGLGISVTKEAIFFDYTGQVLNWAQAVGDELGLNKEKRVLRHLVGLDNSYNYNGTGYNTYLTAGNWVNKVNPLLLTDWTALENARLLFSRMTDQETGERIMVSPDTLVVTEGRRTAAQQILNAIHLETTTNSTQVRRTANQEAGRYTLLSSAILEQVLIDSGVSAANAMEYWVLMAKALRPFVYMQNWSMQQTAVTPDSYTMANNGVVFALFCDEMGAVAVLEPRGSFLAVPA